MASQVYENKQFFLILFEIRVPFNDFSLYQAWSFSADR